MRATKNIITSAVLALGSIAASVMASAAMARDHQRGWHRDRDDDRGRIYSYRYYRQPRYYSTPRYYYSRPYYDTYYDSTPYYYEDTTPYYYDSGPSFELYYNGR
jgi:hypothetical protein